VEPDGTSLDWELHKYAGICAVTDELLADSVINLGAYIVEVAARSRNQWIWQHVAIGTGVGQPTGLGAIAFLGTNTIAQAGAALTERDVKRCNRAVIQNYRNRNVWICNDACLTLICNLQDAAGGALGTGSFLWRVFDDGVNPRPFGRPIYVNNFLPAGATSPGQGVSNLYFIDPNNFVFFRKPGEGFKVSYSEDATVVFGSRTIRAFQDNYKLWRFEERYDTNMIDRNSSSVLTNVHE
jgi:HK97 family phage major capsid protein